MKKANKSIINITLIIRYFFHISGGFPEYISHLSAMGTIALFIKVFRTLFRQQVCYVCTKEIYEGLLRFLHSFKHFFERFLGYSGSDSLFLTDSFTGKRPQNADAAKRKEPQEEGLWPLLLRFLSFEISPP